MSKREIIFRKQHEDGPCPVKFVKCECGWAYNAMWGGWCPICENTGVAKPPFDKRKPKEDSD